jgi:hypothetical protein
MVSLDDARQRDALVRAERARRGRYRSIEELDEVKGVGPATLERLRREAVLFHIRLELLHQNVHAAQARSVSRWCAALRREISFVAPMPGQPR